MKRIVSSVLSFGFIMMSLNAWADADSRSFESRSVGVSTSGFLNHGTDRRDDIYPSLSARWAMERGGSIFHFNAQGELRLTLPPSNYSYFYEASEISVGTSSELSPVQLKVGRKLEHWSRLDEAWQLGIWQPRFRWDYLNPEQVGLTGGYLTAETDHLRLVAFGSPIFIPERGVPIKVQDGILLSDSPWFIAPPSRISILTRDTPVQYNIEMPQMTDIIFHPSASFMARVGPKAGPWGSFAYAYKPMNQVLLAYDGRLQINEAGEDVAKVSIFPRVAYHHLVSAEFGYSGEALNTWVSLLTDRPVKDETPALWTTQEVAPSIAASYGAEWTPSNQIPNWMSSWTKFQLSYLRQWGGNSPDQAPIGAVAKGGGASVFEGRYPFQNAVSMGVQSTPPHFLGKWTKSILASTKALFDLGHQGTIWSTELKYRPREAWMIGVGLDLLGSNESDGRDFVMKYRAYDRAHAGVSYVF